MSTKTRSKTASAFGVGEDFSGSQLPNYYEVGAQFLKTKNSGSARERAKKVLV